MIHRTAYLHGCNPRFKRAAYLPHWTKLPISEYTSVTSASIPLLVLRGKRLEEKVIKAVQPGKGHTVQITGKLTGTRV